MIIATFVHFHIPGEGSIQTGVRSACHFAAPREHRSTSRLFPRSSPRPEGPRSVWCSSQRSWEHVTHCGDGLSSNDSRPGLQGIQRHWQTDGELFIGSSSKSAQTSSQCPPPLDLGFWSFFTFLHHGIEEGERHFLWKPHKKFKGKLVNCAT